MGREGVLEHGGHGAAQFSVTTAIGIVVNGDDLCLLDLCKA